MVLLARHSSSVKLGWRAGGVRRPQLCGRRLFSKFLAISESLKGCVAPNAHIHSAGVSPVSVQIYNEN
jgi:hypothetical protein